MSQFDYRYDAIGRRTDVVTTGTAFGGAGNEELTDWVYDDRNQVIGSSRHAGTDPDAPGAAVPTEARSYNYDPIGNRETAKDQDGATTVNYVSNQVNQYDNVDGTLLSYDLDGNMTADDGGMTLTYNGENRLISASKSGAFTSTFTYDYLGRRVKKAVDSDDDGVVDYEVFYVFDGWNVVREVRREAGVVTDTKRYVWGLDLSGSMQGAGGIGGLLAVVDGSESVFTFDGNGNVSELLDGATGAEQAHYEYDAFGNTVVASGPSAESNAWRFSTKPVDEETGYSYYGYRWYVAGLGRWNRRDPAEEEGGANLYGFVQNAPVRAQDLLGLTSIADILASFFDPDATEETIWVMPESDSYTSLVRDWVYVKVTMDALKAQVASDPKRWNEEHSTTLGWTPTIEPLWDPRAGFNELIASPEGTGVGASIRALINSALTLHATDSLHLAAIGSFRIIATVDYARPCRAQINVWMYNSMTRDPSFQRFEGWFPGRRLPTQYMWWNWKETIAYSSGGQDIVDIPAYYGEYQYYDE